jgi:hypothetical protein
MILTLDISEETESVLSFLAKAEGLSLEEYARQVLEERIRTVPRLGPTEAADKARAFETWARSHAQKPPLPAEALRRENLIRDN